MNIQLKEIIFSDGSKGKYLIVNHPNGNIGRVKILVKQWNELKAIGVNYETVNANISKEDINL